jgi:hypothetical protein
MRKECVCSTRKEEKNKKECKLTSVALSTQACRLLAGLGCGIAFFFVASLKCQAMRKKGARYRPANELESVFCLQVHELNKGHVIHP